MEETEDWIAPSLAKQKGTLPLAGYLSVLEPSIRGGIGGVAG